MLYKDHQQEQNTHQLRIKSTSASLCSLPEALWILDEHTRVDPSSHVQTVSSHQMRGLVWQSQQPYLLCPHALLTTWFIVVLVITLLFSGIWCIDGHDSFEIICCKFIQAVLLNSRIMEGERVPTINLPGTSTPYTLTSWTKSTSPRVSVTSVVATFSPFHLKITVQVQ